MPGGRGHEAVFTGYREKVIDSVLGPVTLRRARYHCARCEKELGCFLNNAPRMRYHWFRSRGLFVGSGVVEAGCKAVIGQRLKQSGTHWTVNGADSIITLRCAEASSQ